jgi:hypothetical protein
MASDERACMPCVRGSWIPADLDLHSKVPEASNTDRPNNYIIRHGRNVSATHDRHDRHYSKSSSLCPRPWHFNSRQGQCLHSCISQLLTVVKKCYTSLVENLQFDDIQCLRYALSKGLGIGIVLGGSIVKVPQVLLSTSF